MDDQNTYNLALYGGTLPTTTAAVAANSQFAPFYPGQLVPEEVVSMPFDTFQASPASLAPPGFPFDSMANLPEQGGPSAGPSHMNDPVSMEQQKTVEGLPSDLVRGVSAEMKDRRRQKNRASQAAFRERRKQQIKTLEEQLAALQKTCDHLHSSNAALQGQKDDMQAEIERLQADNQRLRTSLEASPVPDNSAPVFEPPRPMEPPFHFQSHRR